MVNPQYSRPALSKHGNPGTETGLLVHRGNHHILDGPHPDAAEARRLLFELEYPDPTREPWAMRKQWRVRTKAFREQLCWAVVVGTEEACGQPVRELLKELAARGVHPMVVDDLEAGGQAAN
ncbi:MAG: hypothetical protein KIT83_07850 [Bryobacterales bacterium]|nr:hypothetical protein [Bryobacterales bacterium]